MKILHFLFGALVVLSASAESSMKASDDDLPYEVRDVAIDASGLEISHLSVGEKFDRSPQQVRSDVTHALRTALEATPSGDMQVTVRLKRLYLISSVEAAVPGLDSNVTGTIEVVDVASKKTVVEEFEFTAGAPDFHGAGVVGIILAPGIDKDYADTVAGFAYAVRNRLAEQEIQ